MEYRKGREEIMASRREKAIAELGEPTTLGSHWVIFYTAIFCVGGMILPSLYLQDVRPFEWLAIPFTFFIANLIEYGVHRWPMHRNLPGAEFMLRLHMIHHNYFDEHEYRLRKYPDYVALVFPAIVLNLLTLFVVLPIAYLVFLTVGKNAALLFIATVMGYYLLMQLIHVATHTDESHWINSIPGIEYLWRHHYIHHHHSEMAHANYNFIIPVSDWIFGTNRQELQKREDALSRETTPPLRPGNESR
jgi:hypothetical protein